MSQVKFSLLNMLLKALSFAEFPKNEDDEPSRFYDEMKSRVEIGLSEIIEINEILESAVPEFKVLSENITGNRKNW